MPEMTNDELFAWLSPATAGISTDELKAHRLVVEKAARSVSFSKALDLVGLAHRIDHAFDSETASELLPPNSSGLTTDQGHDLVARLASCTLIEILGKGTTKYTSVALLVQSADFLKHTPAIHEVATRAHHALREAAIASRAAPDAWTLIAKDVETTLSAPPDEDETDETQPALNAAAAIKMLAEKLDTLGTQVEERFAMLAEEHDALWWSYTDRSTTENMPWSQIKPLARRVALASKELGELIPTVPGPPAVAGLLAIALGKDSHKECSLAEIAVAAVEAEVPLDKVVDHHLLPFASAARQIRRLNSTDDTWKTVLGRTRAITVDVKVTALDAAMQLFREVELGTQP